MAEPGMINDAMIRSIEKNSSNIIFLLKYRKLF